MRIKGFALPPRIPGAVLDSTIGRGFCPEAARRLGDHADENDATARTSPSALGRPRGSLPTWSDFASHRMWDASSKLPSGKWATLDSTRRSERALYRPSADSDVEGLAQAQPRNEAAPQVRVPTDCALDRPPLARQERGFGLPVPTPHSPLASDADMMLTATGRPQSGFKQQRKQLAARGPTVASSRESPTES